MSLVSMYIILSRPGCLNDWERTGADLEFYCLAIRDLIAFRREQNQFEIQAEILCTKDADCEVCSPLYLWKTGSLTCQAAVEARNLFCFFWKPTRHSRINVYKKVPFE